MKSILKKTCSKTTKKIFTFLLVIFFFTNLFAKETQLAGDAKKALKEYAGYNELINRGFNLNMLDSIQSAEDLYKVINASGTFNGVSNGIRMSPAEEIKTGLMAIDLSCHPATWYFNLHEGDNRLNDPKVPRSSLINVHYFESDENEKYPHSFGYQMSVELGLAVDTEMAILTQSGV